MLIKFSLRNFKTFREVAEWNMVATSDTTFEADNVVVVPEFNLRLLKLTAVYGANASGKTKLMEAFEAVSNLVRGSLRHGPNSPLPVEPFRLDTSTLAQPSEFEITILAQGACYRYGFQVDASHVVAEWLFRRQPGQAQETRLFYRAKQQLELTGEETPQLHQLWADQVVRPHELLLAKAAQYNSPEAAAVYRWFGQTCVLLQRDPIVYEPLIIRQLNNPFLAPVLLDMMRAADLGIDAARPDTSSEELLIRHTIYNDKKEVMGENWFRFQQEESRGTQQYLALIALVIETLHTGGILLVDELATSLHPQLVRRLVQLFQSSAANPRNAQLLFNTHNTNLLSLDTALRRDQIWFTEKDGYGAAKLYSLAALKPLKPWLPGKPQIEDDLEKRYLSGRYGAVPILGEFGYSDLWVNSPDQ